MAWTLKFNFIYQIINTSYIFLHKRQGKQYRIEICTVSWGLKMSLHDSSGAIVIPEFQAIENSAGDEYQYVSLSSRLLDALNKRIQ